MSFWSKIGGFFLGGGGEKVLDVVDKAYYTKQERNRDDQQDLASARSMQLASHDSWFDILVDGAARLVRPGITLWMVGGFIGWWPLPKMETIAEYWQNIFLIVLTFWFGGRAILKDIPKAVRLMRGLKITR